MMISIKLLPTPGLVFVAIALLAVSWAWTRDWILDRPAPGRWLRLGLFLAGAFALLSAGYVGFRVWSVPDMGPIAKPAAWNERLRGSAVIRPKCGRPLPRSEQPADRPVRLRPNSWPKQGIAGPDPPCGCASPIAGSSNPISKRCSITPTCRRSLRSPGWFRQDAHQRMDQGDLAGSWDDIMVLFHMARHFSEGLGGGPAIRALTSVERDALSLAMEWAVAPGQTPERLHAALAAYREMPKVPSATDVLTRRG